MEMRRCTKCKKEKPVDQFMPKRNLDKTKLTLACEECRHKKAVHYREKKKDPEFIERHKETSKAHYKKAVATKEGREARNKKQRERYHKAKDTPAGERLKAYRRVYDKAYRKKKWASDSVYRLSKNISRGMRYAIKEKKGGKHWEDLVGYTCEDLMLHLESLFEEGMTFENYGEWHIDHRTPISWFNYETAEDDDFKKCWALDNLKPMWAEENCRKSNRYAD